MGMTHGCCHVLQLIEFLGPNHPLCFAEKTTARSFASPSHTRSRPICLPPPRACGSQARCRQGAPRSFLRGFAFAHQPLSLLPPLPLHTPIPGLLHLPPAAPGSVAAKRATAKRRQVVLSEDEEEEQDGDDGGDSGSEYKGEARITCWLRNSISLRPCAGRHCLPV